MHQLIKGGNAPLSASSVVLTVDVGAPADLSALLVTASGKVRSDNDFVFYNQPTGPGVRCVRPAGSQPWKIEVDLNRVPADVHAVRLVVSLDDSTQRFGAVGQPVARVSEPSGAPQAEFTMTGLDTESIVVALELYRRAQAWKIRAVGQGYAGGLAALITDHGVSVDDAPAPVAAPVAAPVRATTPTAAPPAAPPAAQPPAPSYTRTPPPPSAPASAPAATSYGQPAPSYGPPSAAPSYGQPAGPPAAAPSYGQAPPPAPAYGTPAQAPPQRPGSSAGGGEVSLVKGRTVSLTKGQKVSLTKDGGVALTMIRMGLGWDPIKKKGMFGSREVEVDLDASCVLFADGQPVDVAFYNQLRTKDGSIQHTGDNLTGEGEGDDETLLVDLTRVPVHIDTLFFVVTSYQGQTFEQVQNAFCRLVDETSGAELARYTLAGGMAFTGMVMAKVYREGSGWKLQALGEGIQARVPTDAIKMLPRYL